MAAAVHWSPLGRLVIAQLLSSTLMGGVRMPRPAPEPSTTCAVRISGPSLRQCRRFPPSLAPVDWCNHRTDRCRNPNHGPRGAVPVHRQHKLAQAVPGAAAWKSTPITGCASTTQRRSPPWCGHCTWVTREASARQQRKPQAADDPWSVPWHANFMITRRVL
jgi:hypothetical protein